MDFLLTLILWVIFTISGIHKNLRFISLQVKALDGYSMRLHLQGGFLLLSIFPDFALFLDTRI